MKGFARPLLALIAVVVLGLAVARMRVAWHHEAYIDMPVGTLVAMAKDLEAGVFYRPLLSADGYGGTRYFPLHFVILAGLMKAGLPPILAGYVISWISMGMVLIGSYLLLRKLGVERFLSLTATACILAAGSAQLSLLTVRVDALAAAFSLWGVFFCLRALQGQSGILGAALLFSLAVATKPTSVFGFGAGFLALLIAGPRVKAWKLLGLTAAFGGAVLGAMHWFSDGRALKIMKACALGGAGWSVLVHGPQRMLQAAVTDDPGSLAFLVLAGALLFVLPWRSLLGLPTLLFLSTGAVMVLIFGLEGTSFNHLIDLHIAAMVLLATSLGQEEHRWSGYALAALALATVVACQPIWYKLHHGDLRPARQERAQVLNMIDPAQGPLLAENPIFPVLAGQRPYVMDPFMSRALGQRDPAFLETLWQKMREQAFSGIILSHDPNLPEVQELYRTDYFGDGFVEEMNKSYKLSGRVGPYFVLLPRGR